MGKERYGNEKKGSSGVTHYEVTAHGIVVYFGTKKYHYTYTSCGSNHVDAMKRLAAAGTGLASYINANNPDYVGGV